MKNLNLINRISTANGKANTPPVYSHVLFSIFMLFAMFLPSEAWGTTFTQGRTLYFNTSSNSWGKDEAILGAQFFDAGGNCLSTNGRGYNDEGINSSELGNLMNHLTYVSEGIYSISIPYNNAVKVRILRMGNKGAEPKYRWNYSVEMQADDACGKNCIEYTSSGWTGSPNAMQWGTYGDGTSVVEGCTPSTKPNKDYYIAGEGFSGLEWNIKSKKMNWDEDKQVFYYTFENVAANSSMKYRFKINPTPEADNNNWGQQINATKIDNNYKPYANLTLFNDKDRDKNTGDDRITFDLANQSDVTIYTDGNKVWAAIPAPILTSDYYLRGDLWIEGSAWKGVGDGNTPKFVKNASNTEATAWYVMPAGLSKGRFEFYDANNTNSGQSPADFWGSQTGLSNQTTNSNKITFDCPSSPKLLTFTYDLTNKLVVTATNPTLKSGMKVRYRKSGTSTWNEVNLDGGGSAILSNLENNSKYYLTITDGGALHAVNWYGGLYFDMTNSNVAFDNKQAYYSSVSKGTNYPIISAADPTGVFNITGGNTDVKVTFDGGKITINKVAAVTLPDNLYVYGCGGNNFFNDCWKNNLPAYKMTVADGEATYTFNNVSGSTSMKIRDHEANVDRDKEYITEQAQNLTTIIKSISKGSGNNNIDLSLNGVANLTIHYDGTKIWFTAERVATPVAGNEWYIMGSGNSWDWNKNTKTDHNRMTITDGVASISYTGVSDNIAFKVFRGSDQAEFNCSYYDEEASTGKKFSNLADDNICLNGLAHADVTIYWDGTKIWTNVTDYQTLTDDYYLKGSYEGWNGNNWTDNKFTKVDNYIQTITKRVSPNGDNTKNVFKAFTSQWKNEINANNLDASACVNYTKSTPTDNQIRVNPDVTSDVTFTIWKDGNGDRKIAVKVVPVQMHTVKFYDGDNEYETLRVSVENGQSVAKPADPTKSGNIFRGWSETNGGEVVDVTTITINADKNFYAKWEAAEVQNIVFHSNYGSEVANLVVVKGEKATKPADPTKAHCTFRGWYENADFAGSEFDWANTNINTDYELYAKWEYTGSTKHYLVGTFMGCSNWGDCLGNAIEMTKNGDHLEATLPLIYQKGADLRFKINRNASSDWDHSLMWGDFSSSRSTGTIATYNDQNANIQVNLTGEGAYRVTMCYDGVSVYAIITEVATHTVTYQNGLLSTTREVADGEKATALSMAHRGVEVDWYDNEACTGATFDFNTPITEAKTLYAKSRGASGNYYLTGAIWHNWTNENKTPQMSVADGVATYTFIAPVGQNTIRTLKGSRNEGDYIDARYFDEANSATGIKISGDNKQLYFTIADKPKQVTVTFDGAIRVQIEDYTPHYVDNLFLTANGDWCEVWQANGTKVKTGGWDKRKEANKLRQNGTTGYVILRDVQTGERLWKLIGNIDDDSRSGEQLFNAMYVDYANSVSAAGNFEWNMTNCEPLSRQLSYESNEWRNVRFNVKKVCQLKIIFDGGLIRVMDLPQYTVTFNTNGGSAIDAKTVYEEERVAQPAAPTKPLYKFVKWQLNGEDFDFANTPITANITLDAVYELASYSLHGPLWLVSTTNSDYRTDNTPAMINDGEKVTVSVIAPKGYQSFGILRDRSYADNCQIKPTCDNEASNVTVSRGDDMWFHFTLEDAAQVTITYTNAGKVSVTVNYDYVKKDGWGVNNDLKSTWTNTPMDENGELIMRDIQPDLGRGYNLNITAVEGESMAGVNYFGAPYIAMNDEDFWQYTCTSSWGTTIPQISNNKERAYYQDATMKFTAADLIQGKLDLRFTFDGKKITVTPLDRVTITFDSKGGSAVGQVQAFVGNKAAKPADPTNTDGSSFLKWVKADKSEFDWNSTLTENIILYAVWDRVQDLVDATAEGGELELTKDYAGGSVTIDKTITIVGNNHTIGNLTVTESGNLTISDDSYLTVKDFIVKTDAYEHSAQVEGIANLHIEGNAYVDVMYIGNTARTITAEEADYWYELSVPFAINATTSVYRANGDKLNNPTHYEIWEYDGVKRAATGSGWKRCTGNIPAAHTFIIGLDEGADNVVRFKAINKSFSVVESLTLAAYASADAKNADWNAVGNPNFYSVHMGAPVSLYNNNDHKFTTFDAEAAQPFVIGTPLFVQQAAGSVAVSDIHTAAPAPVRARVATSDDLRFCVQIAKASATRMDDQIFVKASAEATMSYEEGVDVVSLNASSTKAALLWTRNYGMRLAIEEAPLADQVTYELGIAAPEDGLYTIRQAEGTEDSELYLTQNGYPIWCLSSSEYSLYLPKGTTEEYGLLIHRAPKVATELTNGQSETTSARKLWYNGHVFILRDGQVFDVTGRMVK